MICAACRPSLTILQFGADGLRARTEVFDADRDEEALARFDELTSGPPSCGNAPCLTARSARVLLRQPRQRLFERRDLCQVSRPAEGAFARDDALEWQDSQGYLVDRHLLSNPSVVEALEPESHVLRRRRGSLENRRADPHHQVANADPRHERYHLIQNVVASQSYVSEFELRDYPVEAGDILHRDAWDAALNTVNIGKYNLGWGSIGICTHAFYEAITHASNRVLYKMHVTDFSHVRQNFVDAYCRLVAMKLFALRAADYMRIASAEDRRYLLYNPMVKMKVTTQGEDVINLLWDTIAARASRKTPISARRPSTSEASRSSKAPSTSTSR